MIECNMLLQLTQREKTHKKLTIKVVLLFYADTVVFGKTTMWIYEPIGAPHWKLFFNAKSLNLTISKSTNFYFQPWMFWLSQQNTRTLDTVY